MRDFRKLEIWQESMQLAKEVIKLAKEFPDWEKYALAQQLSRAAVSIPSNIAEGCSRSSNKEFIRFLNIALGSAFEAETQLLLAKDLHYAPFAKLEQAIEHLHLLQRRINAFRTAIKKQMT